MSPDMTLETFTIYAQFSNTLATLTKNGAKLPLKFVYQTSFDCFFSEKLFKAEAFKLHHVKEYRLLYQKQ